MPSTTHANPHPLAGQTVTANGQQFRVEDWWDRVSAGSCMTAAHIPAEVVYGKIGSFGHLVYAGDLS